MKQKSLEEIISLKGKAAIVTGGAMGIGLGIVNRLAEAGASVLIADINAPAGKQTQKNLTDSGYEVEFIKTDVSKEKDVKKAVSACTKKFGSLDIIVNNAGIYPITPVSNLKQNEFDRILAINLRSVFLFTKYATEAMIKNKIKGKIINISSIDALHPSSIGLAAYDASKHGVWGFTKNSALEYAQYGISINAIAPGGISTPGAGSERPDIKKIQKEFIKKIPMKRMGQPDDIGKVALFLASDLSSYMTGTQVVVDGGVLLS